MNSLMIAAVLLFSGALFGETSAVHTTKEPYVPLNMTFLEELAEEAYQSIMKEKNATKGTTTGPAEGITPGPVVTTTPGPAVGTTSGASVVTTTSSTGAPVTTTKPQATEQVSVSDVEYYDSDDAAATLKPVDKDNENDVGATARFIHIKFTLEEDATEFKIITKSEDPVFRNETITATNLEAERTFAWPAGKPNKQSFFVGDQEYKFNHL